MMSITVVLRTVTIVACTLLSLHPGSVSARPLTQTLSAFGQATVFEGIPATSCHNDTASLNGALVSASAFNKGSACGWSIFVSTLDNSQILTQVVGLCSDCATPDVKFSKENFQELSPGTPLNQEVAVRWGFLFIGDGRRSG
ncbi:hypothetical protein T439DRAFT_201138 [Meredithblackwellia eburnea MCA 4105]